MQNRTSGLFAISLAVVLTACSGGGGADDPTSGRIDDQVVIDPDAVAAAREQAEVTAAPATVAAPDPVTTATPTSDGSGDAAASPDATAPTTLPVAEAEEDELDSLLNSLTVFNDCLSADGFEFIGAPGIDGATADQFEEPYLASLGKCATASNVVEALENFGAAQENRTPEEIAAFNFGLPVFRDCMIGRGWTVGELVPDERGALTFGNALTPPAGTDGFGTDDVAECRLEAEQYVADNYEPEATSGG